jgi:V/A-type H+-transporting ATPase subunit I
MITPMKRAYVVLLDREKREALKELRRLGLLHLEPIQGSGEACDELRTESATLQHAVAALSEYKAIQDVAAFGLREGIEFARGIMRQVAVVSDGLEEAVAIRKEIERCRPWGDFDPAALAALADKGIVLRLAEIASKKLGNLPATLEYIRLADARGRTMVALLADHSLELPVDLTEFRVPGKRLSAMQADLVACEARVAAARKALAAKAARRDALSVVQSRLERDLAFESIRSGMAVDETLAWFAGWLPAKDTQRLSQMATRNGWGLILDDPLDEEQPPTRVENNAIVRIIQPVFDFLGTVPNYREYDISLWFLLFFGLFFAMIFGDAGYGLLMLGATLFVAFKRVGNRKAVGDGTRLFLFLSSLTVLWGMLSGNWFGLAPEVLPAFIKVLALPPLASWNPAAGDNIKVLCFILGTIQLSIAHVKNFIRDFPRPKCIGQLGSLALVLGMYFLVLNLVVDAQRFAIPSFGLYMIAGGFTASFIFGNWETSPVQAILDSLKNIISIFLGTVSFFADIVSYIRLWAVGLAGVAISQTINGMAGGLLRIPLAFIFGVMILLLGHGLNLVMGALSVVVHGVRLNMLEFSGHMSMEWSGYRYEPFKESDDNRPYKKGA